MKVILEEGEGKNDGFTAVSSHEISKIPEYKNGNSNEDFGQRHEAFKESSRANNF